MTELLACARQLIGLFILTRERQHWKYIQYTMYVQFVMLAYFVFLMWLMCISIRTVRARHWLEHRRPRLRR